MEALIHHWITVISTLGGTSVAIAAIRAGLFDKAGEYLFEKWIEPFLDKTRLFKGWGKKRHKNGKGHLVQIAALKQQVKDQGLQIRSLVTRQNKTDRSLVQCQAERTECRADMKNILFRVAALEKKRA